MICFIEDKTFGYRSRTIRNASADVTIAIAIDFTTAGERLTRESVLNQNNLYIPINWETLHSSIERTIRLLNSLKKPEVILNIAGNGIYTLNKISLNQSVVDEHVYIFLKDIICSSDLKIKIKGIRTGGQSGIDEAGAKAGDRLNIPTLVLALILVLNELLSVCNNPTDVETLAVY
jgi:hypothetical protein